MPMVADAPSAYADQPGFDFLRDVPTTWDETRFVCGEPGEWIVLARRRGQVWYMGGITNEKSRKISVPLRFLPEGTCAMRLYSDTSLDDTQPNSLAVKQLPVDRATQLSIATAPGGGFVAVIEGPVSENAVNTGTVDEGAVIDDE